MNFPPGVLLVVLLYINSNLFAQTANVNATQESKDILQYLVDIRAGCHFIFGQNLGHGAEINMNYNPLVEQVFVNTGKRLAFIGSEYGLSPQNDLYNANETLIDHWNNGGMITISWRAPNPWSGLTANDTSHLTEIGNLVIPGNPAYIAWRNELSQIADVLQELRDNGVVVLWRPLPEMNGNWFWWGHNQNSNNASSFINLWVDMFDYLTNERQLNNLLWVYSVSHSFESPVDFYYPGDEYVDIAGINIVDDDTNLIFADDFNKLNNLGKPLAITEFSPALPHPVGNYDYTLLLDKLKNQWGNCVYSYAWHDFPDGINSYASNLNENQILNDPCSITLEELYVLADKNLENNAAINVFPNPTTETCYIQSSTIGFLIENLTITDYTGIIIEHIKFDQQADVSLSISNLPSGIYFLLIGGEGKKYVKKLVKE